MATASSNRAERATESDRPAGEVRTLIRDVGWDGCEALMGWFGDDAPRMTYADGTIELMSPHVTHEEAKKNLAFLVETIAEELGIPIRPLASVTFKKRGADRMVEPDESYYFAANVGLVTSRKSVDLDVVPPPDLSIEVENTSSLLDKLDVYARMGFPEVWRYDGEDLTVLILDAEGRYSASIRSASLAFVPMADLVDRLHDYDGDDLAWRRGSRAWVRDVLAPIHRDHQAEG